MSDQSGITADQPTAPDPVTDPAAQAPEAAPTQEQAPAAEQPSAWPEPIAAYQEQLEQLAAPDPDDPEFVPLQQLLGFYELLNTAGAEDAPPEVVEQLESWWENLGQQMGFLDDEGEPVDPTGGDPNDELEQPGDEITQLRQTVQQLQQRLDSQEQQGTIEASAQKMEQQLNTLMAQHGINEDRQNTPEDKWPSTRILRLAASYDGDPRAIEYAVNDFLEMTGQAQQGMLEGAGQQTMSVDQLASGGAPAPALSGGRADMEPEPVQSWQSASQGALARLRGQG